jgi:hypothetical protein
MTPRSRRTLVALLLIFAVLLVAGLVVSTQRANAPTTEPYPFPRVFPDLTQPEIVGVRLSDPQRGDSFSMVRDEAGRWYTPAGVRLTDDAELIARTLALLPYDRTLPLETEDDLADYGFTPEGLLRVEMILADGSSHAIAVGGLAPTNLVYYAVIDDLREVTLLLRPAIDYLMTELRNPPTA